MSLREIEAAIETLSPEEQARFADWYEERRVSLMEFDPTVEEAWADEVQRRIAELDSGQVQGIPAEQVFARARKILGR